MGTRKSYKANPEYVYDDTLHTNHGKLFSRNELIYLCKFYDYDGPVTISYAMGRTPKALTELIARLKRTGEYETYKNMSLDEWTKFADKGSFFYE